MQQIRFELEIPVPVHTVLLPTPTMERILSDLEHRQTQRTLR